MSTFFFPSAGLSFCATEGSSPPLTTIPSRGRNRAYQAKALMQRAYMNSGPMEWWCGFLMPTISWLPRMEIAIFVPLILLGLSRLGAHFLPPDTKVIVTTGRQTPDRKLAHAK